MKAHITPKYQTSSHRSYRSSNSDWQLSSEISERQSMRHDVYDTLRVRIEDDINFPSAV